MDSTDSYNKNNKITENEIAVSKSDTNRKGTTRETEKGSEMSKEEFGLIWERFILLQ